VRILARLLLVAALLFAQAGGVAHEIWHATSDLAVDGKAPQKSALCDFHTALGSVTAALTCAHHAPEVVLQGNTSLIGAESSAPRFSLLAARSRGPPTLL
jgi:hypothetical protein